LKQAADLEFLPLSDGDLILNAEDVFLTLDQEELDYEQS
jgi:hypothetical protein